MNIDDAVAEWKGKKRRMGCVSASNWFCKRVPGFYPIRFKYLMLDGRYMEHVIASDGVISIDLAPYANIPED